MVLASRYKVELAELGMNALHGAVDWPWLDAMTNQSLSIISSPSGQGRENTAISNDPSLLPTASITFLFLIVTH